jgi:hypothetical protein
MTWTAHRGRYPVQLLLCPNTRGSVHSGHFIESNEFEMWKLKFYNPSKFPKSVNFLVRELNTTVLYNLNGGGDRAGVKEHWQNLTKT